MITIVLSSITIAVYLYGVHVYRERFPGRPFRNLRVLSFVSGVAAMTLVLIPPLDTLADASFAWHMVQHVVLMLVGPPLMLLGAPLLLLVAATPPKVARRITGFAQSRAGDVIFAPIVGWLFFVAVLWLSHFTPLYEAALQYPTVHVMEHVLYITSAMLFWSAVVQVGYAPRPMPYVVRIAYLFLAIPQGAFLGFAIFATHNVLYPHYLLDHTRAAALADQHNGGAVMWIAGGLLLFTAFMCTAASWAAAERADVSAPG